MPNNASIRNTSFLSGLRRWLVGLLATIGLVVIIVIATPLDVWWAHAYAGSIEQPKGDVLILLSAADDDGGFISYSSYWRARYALLAWRNGGFRTIIVSGGSGHAIRDFLVAEGVPSKLIISDPSPNSTRENALDTAAIVRNMPGSKVLLTSDFHMYRALRVFRKLGINVTPYAAPDVMKLSQHWYGRLPGFQTLVIETGKIAYYRVRQWM